MSVGLYYELMRLHHNDFGEIGEIGEKSEQRFTSMYNCSLDQGL